MTVAPLAFIFFILKKKVFCYKKINKDIEQIYFFKQERG